MARAKMRIALRPAVYPADRAKGRKIPLLKSNGTLGTAALVERMASGGSVSQAQASAFLHRLLEVMGEALLGGQRVQLGRLGILEMHAQGLFEADGRPVTGKKPTVELGFRPSKEVKKLLKDFGYEVVEASTREPQLEYVHNTEDGRPVKSLVPGELYCAAGRLLTYKASAADEGLFLVQGNRFGAGVKIKKMSMSDSRKVAFRLPNDTKPGNYWLELRRRFPRSEHIRVARLEIVISEL